MQEHGEAPLGNSPVRSRHVKKEPAATAAAAAEVAVGEEHRIAAPVVLVTRWNMAAGNSAAPAVVAPVVALM